jgi:hypothetical protein
LYFIMLSNAELQDLTLALNDPRVGRSGDRSRPCRVTGPPAARDFVTISAGARDHPTRADLLIWRRQLDAVDDERFDRAALGFEFESELFLKRGED